MKTLLLLTLSLLFAMHTNAYEVSGTATNAETGNPLVNVDIILAYTTGGIAGESVTSSDGSFTITGIEDGTYQLELYTYPDPIILGGDYFLPTTYDDLITINGSNVSGIEFKIPPHHPIYTLTGVLYDAVTNDTIKIQDFQVQAKMKYLVEFFIDYETENGVYILENMPDWTYEFTLFDNDYYEGVAQDITIDTLGPDTIQMDFYLQPKMGATVSGVLLDSATNQPVMQAGRSIKLQAINSLFTETNDQGEFTFVNVPPDIYADIEVTSQDTDYVNCSGSEITGFTVSEGGVSDVELYQKQWISIHEVTADGYTFEPGETKTVKFSIVNDDLSYGAIWGVNLIFPEGVTVLSSTPFYCVTGDDVIFDQLPDCSSDERKAWEGWHFVGIPPYASSEGNLEILNEAAWANLTLQFADSASMEMAPIFYEIYYDIHCFSIQPFSYGTLMMVNDNITGASESLAIGNRVNIYPNPAKSQAIISLNLDRTRKGRIVLSDIAGQEVMNTEPRIFNEGNSKIEINTGRITNGIYYYTFFSDDIRLTDKLVIFK